MSQLKASIIGLRGHAGLHLRLLQENRTVVLDKVLYHRSPPPEYSGLPITGDLSDCLGSDLIIISSPTSTHFEYLKSLVDFPGYILLEKPAASRTDQIQELLKLPDDLKSRTRINFNLAFHDLTDLLTTSIARGELGKVFAFDVHTSHGVAFKKDWQNAWRILGESGLGPIESTGIHWVQFSLRAFGECLNSQVDTACLTGAASAVDTGIVNMKMASGVWARIRHSYACPFGARVEAWGTEGYFIYDGEVARTYYPRETFDSDGLFTTPPVKHRQSIDFKSAWAESLRRSQSAFVDSVQRRVRFDTAEFDRDLLAMNVLLGGKMK